jgi:group II intron reverse transcriptase/maturase
MGGRGSRQLGIPTVIDRMIQQAIHQVLSPIWEPIFSDYSYGFRPKRNAHQALKQANVYINAGYQDIIDMDLKSFFDRVDHDKLMGLLRRKIEDPILLRLIRKYLRAGMVIDGQCSKRTIGTPQGGPLSPLLSNILLTELDNELDRRGIRFVRYADDCSMFLKSKKAAYRVLENIKQFLENKLKLQVNVKKTSICRPVKFELLGYCFTSTYKKG